MGAKLWTKFIQQLLESCTLSCRYLVLAQLREWWCSRGCREDIDSSQQNPHGLFIEVVLVIGLDLKSPIQFEPQKPCLLSRLAVWKCLGGWSKFYISHKVWVFTCCFMEKFESTEGRYWPRSPTLTPTYCHMSLLPPTFLSIPSFVLGTKWKLMKRTNYCAIQWASAWAHDAFHPFNNPVKR